MPCSGCLALHGVNPNSKKIRDKTKRIVVNISITVNKIYNKWV